MKNKKKVFMIIGLLTIMLFNFKIIIDCHNLNKEINYYNHEIDHLNEKIKKSDISKILASIKDKRKTISHQEKSIYYQKKLLNIKQESYDEINDFNAYIDNRIISFSIPIDKRESYLTDLYNKYSQHPGEFRKTSAFNLFNYPGYMNTASLIWSDDLTTYQQFYAISNLLDHPDYSRENRYVLFNYMFTNDRLFVYDCKEEKIVSEIKNSIKTIVVPSKDRVVFISTDPWESLDGRNRTEDFEGYGKYSQIKITHLKDNYTIVVGKQGDGFYYSDIALLEDESGIIYTLKYLDDHEEERILKW